MLIAISRSLQRKRHARFVSANSYISLILLRKFRDYSNPYPPPCQGELLCRRANSLITYSGSSVVRHCRCGHPFIVEIVHGAQSTFRVTTVTSLPRGPHR